MEDAYGISVKVDDKIVYAVKSHSSLHIYRAIVLEVNERSIRVLTWDPSTWRGYANKPLMRETTLCASNFVITSNVAEGR